MSSQSQNPNQEPEGCLSLLGKGFLYALGLGFLVEVVGPVLLILIIIAAACGGIGLFNYSKQDKAVPSIVFAGKVVNPATGEWPNNRLVILYLNGQEIGKVRTQRGEYQPAETGIEDGLFAIAADNPYQLSQESLDENRKDDPRFRYASASWSKNFAYLWIDEIGEGNTLEIPIPSKNIVYTIKVIAGDAADLPAPLVENPTILQDTGTIMIAPKAQEAPVSLSGPGSDVLLQNISFQPVTEEIELTRLVFPINNCAGNVRLSQQYSETKTFIHEYQFEVGAKVGATIPTIFGILSPQLQAKYGFKNGEVETKTFNYELAAEPGTGTKYTIIYREIWEVGTADLRIGNDLATIPFRIKKTLIQQIDTEKINCN